MHISIETNPNTIIVSHGGDITEEVRLPWITTNLWNKLGKLGTVKVFGPLNEYFESLPPPHQDAIFNIYAEAHAVFDRNLSFDENTQLLKPIVAKLIACVDHEAMRHWLFKHGNIAYNSDIRETYTGEYPERQTYLKDEYNELVALAMMFKSLVPIWAMYLAGYSDARGKDYRDSSAFGLVSESLLMDLPAMDRLADYCEALAEKNSKLFTPAICQSIGSDEIPRMFLAMAAVRRLSVGDIRDPDRTLIKEVYKYLESTTLSFSKGVRDKRSTRGEGDEQESVSERYRISEMVPSMTSTEVEVDLMDLELMCRRLSEGGAMALDPERVLQRKERLENDPLFTIVDYHFTLTAIPLKHLVSPMMLVQINREPLLHAIALAATVYEAYGPITLCEFLLAGRLERDPESVGEVSGFTLRELPQDLHDQMDALYPYRQIDNAGRPKTSPGATLIHNVVQEINQFDWLDGGAVPTTLRSDIATALIQYLG